MMNRTAGINPKKMDVAGMYADALELKFCCVAIGVSENCFVGVLIGFTITGVTVLVGVLIGIMLNSGESNFLYEYQAPVNLSLCTLFHHVTKRMLPCKITDWGAEGS